MGGRGGWGGGEDGREGTTHGLSYTQTLPKVMTQGTELFEGGRCNEDGSVRCMHAEYILGPSRTDHSGNLTSISIATTRARLDCNFRQGVRGGSSGQLDWQHKHACVSK